MTMAFPRERNRPEVHTKEAKMTSDHVKSIKYVPQECRWRFHVIRNKKSSKFEAYIKEDTT